MIAIRTAIAAALVIATAALTQSARTHAIASGPMPDARPGTPQEGEYALGWGVVKFDWSTMPLLNHGGSNSMNLATILVDTDQDLAVVVLTNFPERQAKAAVGAVMEMLYRRYGTKAN